MLITTSAFAQDATFTTTYHDPASCNIVIEYTNNTFGTLVWERTTPGVGTGIVSGPAFIPSGVLISIAPEVKGTVHTATSLILLPGFGTWNSINGGNRFVVACINPNDTDGDGVLQAVDECPMTPGPADNDGCPYSAEQEAAIQFHIDNPGWDGRLQGTSHCAIYPSGDRVHIHQIRNSTSVHTITVTLADLAGINEMQIISSPDRTVNVQLHPHNQLMIECEGRDELHGDIKVQQYFAPNATTAFADNSGNAWQKGEYRRN